MKNIKKKVAILIVISVILGLYLFEPTINENVNYVFMLIKEFKLEELKQYIISFGFIGPIISFALLIMQCMIAPLPLSIIVFANAYIYGLVVGSLISCIGTLIGACLSFGLSRVYGRDIAEKFISKKTLDSCDKIFDKYGKKVILASRVLPFISFDGFSYAAGLTKVNFKYFFWATAIGQIPIIVALSMLGISLESKEKFTNGILICSLITIIAMVLSYAVYRKKYNGLSIKEMMKDRYTIYLKKIDDKFKK